MKDLAKVGVVIARFQTPKLHAGHLELLNAVTAKHKKTLVLLGVSPVKNTRNNPLDYATREAMVKASYPDVVVMPITDMPSDQEWSRRVDKAIEETFNDTPAVLYGSRDSALPSYKGKYEKRELPPAHKISATELREVAAAGVRKTQDFRAGMIYAAHGRYPTSFQCVDIVPVKRTAGVQTADGTNIDETTEVLLARKRTDKEGLYRTIGGFVSPDDENLEVAALRELSEEASINLSVHRPHYAGSTRVQDYRYEREVDKIMTAVFVVDVMYGRPEAGDDIDEVRWFKVEEVTLDMLVPEHHAVWPLVQAYLGKAVAQPVAE